MKINASPLLSITLARRRSTLFGRTRMIGISPGFKRRKNKAIGLRFYNFKKKALLDI